MMQTVQLSIGDSALSAALRDAVSRSCAWRIEAFDRPDPTQQCVLVLDELAFARLPLPLSNPERVVLITKKDPQLLAQAWEAGIVSVVAETDPISTVLLAVMAAGLRVAKSSGSAAAGGISPNSGTACAPLAPQNRSYGSRRCKNP